ncbi:Acyl-CoA N-acyltransferase [Pochonia chlamydosporia 170]|uniref:Acyl-CoA N-acyltransferase n=1 Tax=Pochonia chlamydosporia 170 TaxID=1380566 RepID=A0A179FXM2_METCM|nr:Acyl-CoA N-acyltransferase [Pochonia chlamydosporia 170]OAQ70127.1 Acyl-CoA N-acyltransferase [Pochonia chlamydosporia 170]
MDSSASVVSSRTPQPGEGDNLAKICDEMRLWIAQVPGIKQQFDSSDDGGAKAKSSRSTIVVPSKEGSPDLESLKLTTHRLPEPEKNNMGETNDSKVTQSFPKDSLKPSSTLEEVTNGIGDVIISSPNIGNSQVGSEIRNIRERRTPDERVSDAPHPAPLHIIQAATAPFSVGKPKLEQAEQSWSISSACYVEDISENDAPWHKLLSQMEPAIHDVNNTCSPPHVHHIRDQYGELLTYATSIGKHGLLEAWLTEFPAPSSVTVPNECLGNDSFVEKAINPENGEFFGPIVQPDTVRRRTDGPCVGYNDISWRQANMTTELHIKREVKSRESIATEIRMALEQIEPRPLSVVEDDQWPDAQCVIRSATPSDFAQIADIINAEASATKSPQIFKGSVVEGEDVSKIFDACRRNYRPFIVAAPAEDDFLDQSKWPSNSGKVYKEFAKYMAAHPKPASPIVGFAFVTDYHMGWDGTPCAASRLTGQVRLVVHPNHRRKLYGSALMDRILLSVSPFHRSALDHAWKCAAGKGVYEFPVTRNKRQYTQLYLELFCEKNDPETYKWRTELLKKFGFQDIGYFFNAVVRMDEQHHCQWYDKVLLATEITPTSKVIARRSFSWSEPGSSDNDIAHT